jgi:hypothetical protein
MLKKLAIHDVQDISELFSLADKCARVTEGRAWHSQPAPKTMKAGKPDADAAAQSNGKNKKKKKKADSNNKSLVGASTAAAAAAGGGHGPRGDKRPRQPSGSDEGDLRCPVHNSRRHSAEECREIKKLVKQFLKQQKQQPCRDGTPPRQQEGKQQVAPRVTKSRTWSSRMPRGHSRSSTTTLTPTPAPTSTASSSTSCMEAPGTSRPREAPHHKWMETSIGFNTSNCPKNMAGAPSSY